ncbi:hypothetical protein V6C03_11035 [Methyloligella sp. 2.7D]|uniref:hypothetical protein n=1 Tax=unclassified Methyloligella TaxID=2625955 RepID=UPI00157C455A|nr:hypothetical protein [Methyloligella sp. GL2]QKP77645.1 hypothetical protein HT051_09425 [Methyloligella sp. GL2]
MFLSPHILSLASAFALFLSVSSAASAASSKPCSDGSARLPATGICSGEAMQRLAFGGAKKAPPPGCEWGVNETPMPGGAYLLYLAAKCGGQVSKLKFSGGAQSGRLSLATSALGQGKTGATVATAFAAKGSPEKAIFKLAAAAMPASEKAKCEVREVALDGGYGSDAYEVDYKPKYRAALPTDKLNWVCGKYGLNEGRASFWRVFGDFSWFFDMGQASYWDVDPSTITLLTARDLKH